MKVVLLADENAAGGPMFAMLDRMTRDDALVAVGNVAVRLGGMLKKRRRDERPALAATFMETHRNHAEAARRMAMQLTAYHQPQVILIHGDPDPVLQEQVEYYAANLPTAILVQSIEEFVKERGRS